MSFKLLNNFFNYYDPDGKSRRLIIRILIALFFAIITFKSLGLQDKFLLWLILCQVNNLMALSLAPKDFLLKYYFINLFMTLTMLTSALLIGSSSDYFIPSVALLGFIAGMTSGYGQSGKMIGALGFILFAMTSFTNSPSSDFEYIYAAFFIANFFTFIVIFVFVPIPKYKILQENKKIALKLLCEILNSPDRYTPMQASVIFRGIKESVCSRLPKECFEVSEFFIALKNLIFITVKFDTTEFIDNEDFKDIYTIFDNLKLVIEKLLYEIAIEKDCSKTLELFENTKNLLNSKIVKLYNTNQLDTRQITHIATAAYIVNEFARLFAKKEML